MRLPTLIGKPLSPEQQEQARLDQVREYCDSQQDSEVDVKKNILPADVPTQRQDATFPKKSSPAPEHNCKYHYPPYNCPVSHRHKESGLCEDKPDCVVAEQFKINIERGWYS